MSTYRLYLDESGDHAYSCLEDPAKRYLGLTGCVIESQYYRTEFHPALEGLKQKHFPHDPDEPLILHRSDIINRRGPFWCLREKAKLSAFNQDLLRFIEGSRYVIISVVIDKKAHAERYAEAAFHPYHYCLAAVLERFCGFLNFYNARGDVMAESRGATEDRQLKRAYQNVVLSGTQWRGSEFFEKVLTSKHLKLKPKAANISGLQLADLLAHPSKQEILHDNGRLQPSGDIFGLQISKAAAGKYNRHLYQGRVHGYGKIFLK